MPQMFKVNKIAANEAVNYIFSLITFAFAPFTSKLYNEQFAVHVVILPPV